MTLDTKDDRTLFFDMMPVFFRSASGVKVKLKLYTVPGQVMHESTRRIVLQGTDAIVFVADARRSEAPATLAYWNNMLKNLEANQLVPGELPIVVQLNKRDLPDVRDEDELQDLSQVVCPAVIPAVAIRGEGVVETLYALLTLTFRSLDVRIGLERSWHISEREFLSQIFSHVDLRGTRLAGAAGAAR
jgi:signal recognition particle receptor subunit beta